MQASYNATGGAIFDVLHWDNLSLRRKTFKANLMFKILNGKAPPTYLQELFSVRSIGYNIRNSEMRLNLPKPRTDYMKKRFCYSGAELLPPQKFKGIYSVTCNNNNILEKVLLVYSHCSPHQTMHLVEIMIKNGGK